MLCRSWTVEIARVGKEVGTRFPFRYFKRELGAPAAAG
jgi:hypothetical protein